MKSLWVAPLFFGIVGPLVGVLLILFFALLLSPGSIVSHVAAVFLGMLLAPGMAYIMGFIPALIAGAVYSLLGWLCLWLGRSQVFGVIFAVAAGIFGGVLGMAAFNYYMAHQALQNGTLFLGFGALVGAICGAMHRMAIYGRAQQITPVDVPASRGRV